jgi:hypothetical protein
MTRRVFERLLENVKRDGRLESVIVAAELPDGTLQIIDGAHRKAAALEAGVKKVPVLVLRGLNDQQRVSKQLAHNALVGDDDPVVLEELFNSITDADLKALTGLSDGLDRLVFQPIEIPETDYRSVLLVFLPSQLDRVNACLEDLRLQLSSELQMVMVEHAAAFRQFLAAAKRIRAELDIRSQRTLVARMAELAQERLQELHDERERATASPSAG